MGREVSSSSSASVLSGGPLQINVYAQLPGLISACAVLMLLALTYPFVTPGALSHHMGLHIALMNVAAPLCAAALWLLRPALHERPMHGTTLWAATIAQMALLWVWHAPAVQASAMSSPLLQVFLHISLLASAVLFWRSVLDASGVRWQSILALMVTGKLACLLGVLLVFSPRVLYDIPLVQHGAQHAAGVPDLADQHLAGLLMMAACPLSYVLAGVVLAAQIMTGLAGASRPLHRCNAPAIG